MRDKSFSQSEMLLEEAKKARKNSYSPTVCAERVAFFKALSEGERDFTAIAIVGGSGEDPDPLVAPCGVCRQVMAEFCDAAGFKIYLIGKELTLSQLLPYGFGKDNVR